MRAAALKPSIVEKESAISWLELSAGGVGVTDGVGCATASPALGIVPKTPL
jgi:hypothetical protein